jgi:hypothetical protein
MTLRLAAVLLLIALPGGAQPLIAPGEAKLAHRIAGCYRLRDGPWRADSVIAGDVSMKSTPLSFELTEQRLDGWEMMQTVERPMFVARDSAGRFTYWRHMDDPRKVVIRVSPTPLAFAGIDLTFTPVGRDLVGTVSAFTDAVEARKPSAVDRRVRARRVACTR